MEVIAVLHTAWLINKRVDTHYSSSHHEETLTKSPKPHAPFCSTTWKRTNKWSEKHLVTTRCSAGKPWVLTFMLMPSLKHTTWLNTIADQEHPLMAAGPGTLQTLVKEWHQNTLDKEFKASTAPPNSSDPDQNEHLWEVLEQVQSMKGALPCNQQDSKYKPLMSRCWTPKYSLWDSPDGSEPIAIHCGAFTDRTGKN